MPEALDQIASDYREKRFAQALASAWGFRDEAACYTFLACRPGAPALPALLLLDGCREALQSGHNDLLQAIDDASPGPLLYCMDPAECSKRLEWQPVWDFRRQVLRAFVATAKALPSLNASIVAGSVSRRDPGFRDLVTRCGVPGAQILDIIDALLPPRADVRWLPRGPRREVHAVGVSGNDVEVFRLTLAGLGAPHLLLRSGNPHRRHGAGIAAHVAIQPQG